ncbi:hypothetical protein Tco_0589076 [Tanacetum coccineum]
MHNYHLDRGVPRCAFKVDIQKAYDTGDPLSPYLFTIVMEVLTLILRRRVRDSDLFSYHRDCKELIEKVEGRINDWKNKSLSITGRLQLVQSVIASMHVYWASVFILPSRILLEIEQLMRGFLWCQGGLSRGKAKVAWEVVCLSQKLISGLGIRRLYLFNKALITTHIWKLLSMKESLWVKWIHKYKIRDHNFWELPCHVHWCSISPLASIVVTRYMNRDGLKTSSKVSDVFQNGTVVWPQELVARYPLLGSIVGPNSVGFIDTLEWLDNVGVVKPFSVNTVWQAVRPSKLKMQDLLRSWDVSAKRRTLKCIIAKLVVAAAAYFIWHERNYRLFKRAKRSEDHVVDCILSSVRLKLFSCHFKQSQEGFDLMRR